MKVISSFKGQYRPFSNFWRAEVRPFWWPSTLPAFPGNEWLFQAWKVEPKDSYAWLSEVEWISEASSPGEAKRRGRVTAILRPDWEEIKIDVMRYCVQLKFRNHDNLRQLLLDTGDATLIEGNTWGDRFWGAEYNYGFKAEDDKWLGHNWLGKLLMEEREELRK